MSMMQTRRRFLTSVSLAAAAGLPSGSPFCAVDTPPRAARLLVDEGFTQCYDYALQTISELPYDEWREFGAEDTVRFYALRLRETGFIQSTSQKIIVEVKT